MYTYKGSDSMEFLGKSNELELIWKHTSDAIFIIEESGKMYKANPAFEQMFGWTEEELILLPYPMIIPNFNQKNQMQFIKRLDLGEKLVNIERERIHRNGEFVYVVASYQLLYIDDKKYVVAIYKDISELKRVEMKNKDIKQRLESLFLNNPDIVWSTDTKGNIISVNPAVKEVLGYTEEEVINSPIDVLTGWTEDQFNVHMNYVN